MTVIFSTSIKPSTNASSDAFGSLRVSQPDTIFDSKQLYDTQSLFWDDQQTSGSGTSSAFLANNSLTRMNVGATTAGTRVRQTFRRFNYQAGKSMLIKCTGTLGAGAAGIRRRIGYFDGYNGVFFELNGTTLRTVTRTYTSGSIVDGYTNSTSWNLDKLDGYGPSGITINTSKVQIFLIDFQWLGAGIVRFGVNIDGNTIYVHQTGAANNLSTVYMQMPNLPIRYEINNDGTGAASSLDHICSTVISEGGSQLTGAILSADRVATVFTTGNDTNIYPILSIRIDPTKLATDISIDHLNILTTSTITFRYTLLLNPTIVGTALSFASITNSNLQVAATTTNATTVTGGTLLDSQYFDVNATKGAMPASTVSIPSTIKLGSTIAGASDIICMCVQRVVGTTGDFWPTITWREKA